MRQIDKQHPKSEPINVAEPGVYYGNSRFSLVFHKGPIDPHGNLNGVLEEDVLAALEDRAELLGQLELADALNKARQIAAESRIEPEDPTDVLLAEAATDVQTD